MYHNLLSYRYLDLAGSRPFWLDLGMHRILFLPDIRPAGYPANPKAGYRISGKGRIPDIRCIPSWIRIWRQYFTNVNNLSFKFNRNKCYCRVRNTGVDYCGPAIFSHLLHGADHAVWFEVQSVYSTVHISKAKIRIVSLSYGSGARSGSFSSNIESPL
jgi:hypothetical protein